MFLLLLAGAGSQPHDLLLVLLTHVEQEFPQRDVARFLVEHAIEAADEPIHIRIILFVFHKL
jgi:hypothetical protein